jgi:predicted adenylyl cyclase CyaB
MAVEIEAKVRIDSADVVREALRRAGAACVGSRFELNAFFDSADRTLTSGDRGLRVRLHKARGKPDEVVMTFKGPRQGSALKVREEIELVVDDFDAAARLLERLGYKPTLGFEKRRESWSLDGCSIEIDELPVEGFFAEVEGSRAEDVHAVLARIGLSGRELLTTSYIAMMDAAVKANRATGPVVRFASAQA